MYELDGGTDHSHHPTGAFIDNNGGSNPITDTDQRRSPHFNHPAVVSQDKARAVPLNSVVRDAALRYRTRSSCRTCRRTDERGYASRDRRAGWSMDERDGNSDGDAKPT